MRLMLTMAAVELINHHLNLSLVGDNNPPALTALFHLRSALIWWMQGVLEPGDWTMTSYLPALTYPEVVAALVACGFWQASTEELAALREAGIPLAGTLNLLPAGRSAQSG